MLNTSTAVPQPGQLPSLSGELLPAVLLIGIVGFLVVVYLCLDGLNTRLYPSAEGQPAAR